MPKSGSKSGSKGSVKGTKSGGNPNYPSKTDNASGKGRGNVPKK